MGFANNVIPGWMANDPDFIRFMQDPDSYTPPEPAKESMLSVDLIAATELRPAFFKTLAVNWGSDYDESDLEILAEFAGRGCYQSWSRPNPETADTDQYIIRNILAKGHESVLEHPTATFYVQGMSRSCAYELLRHRHLSRSELSQRYVDMSNARMVPPPAVRDAVIAQEATPDEANQFWQDQELWNSVKRAYKGIADDLAELSPGMTNKQVREAQRSVLPNTTETMFTTTGNLRAWRHVIKMRGALDADAEIREFALEVYRQLSEDSPAIFADMSIITADDGREFIRYV